MRNGPSAATAVYVVPGEASADAITRSLQSLLPTRQHPIARHRFTVLDTFDGRVRRARACLTRGGHNGNSTVAWQPSDGGSRLTLQLKQPVAFAWDLPMASSAGSAPVIGPRRLLDQADAGARCPARHPRQPAVRPWRAQNRVGPGPAGASGGSWRTLPTMVTLTGLRGYEDAFARLVPMMKAVPASRVS